MTFNPMLEGRATDSLVCRPAGWVIDRKIEHVCCIYICVTVPPLMSGQVNPRADH